IGATAQRPPLPMVMPADIAGGTPVGPSRGIRVLAEDRVPADFPSAQLVVPKKVVFKAPDGVEVHAQLFEPPDSPPISSTSPEVKSVPPRGSGWVSAHHAFSPMSTDPCARFSTRSGGMTLARRFNAGERRMIVRVAHGFQPERL